MIVVDTNVIGYLFLAGERSEQAEQLLTKAVEWAAPLLWRSELRNVLATCVSQHIIELEDALQIMGEAEQLMDGAEYWTASNQVLQLSAKSGCSAYDCEFAALATDLNVPLVTSDRKLLERFPEVAVSPEEFLSRH